MAYESDKREPDQKRHSRERAQKAQKQIGPFVRSAPFCRVGLVNRDHADETANEHEWTLISEELWRSRHQRPTHVLVLHHIALPTCVIHSCALAFIRGSNESFRFNPT
jgi:hypothetical protein